MEKTQNVENIQIPIDVKQDLEALAKDNGSTMEDIMRMLIDANKPKEYLAKSIVGKKNATNVPSIIREQMGIAPGSIIYWNIKEDNIILNVKK